MSVLITCEKHCKIKCSGIYFSFWLSIENGKVKNSFFLSYGYFFLLYFNLFL